MTKSDMDSRIASLKEGVRQVDAKTDKLNALFMQWTEQLTGVRVSAFVNLSPPDPREGEEIWHGGEELWQVGWAKVGSTWQMAARRLKDDIDPHSLQAALDRRAWTYEPPIPLVSAPRGVRILAVDEFDSLVTELGRELDLYNQAIDTALVPQKRIV